MKIVSTLVILLVATSLSYAQDRSLYEKQLFILGEDTLPCRILTPQNFKPGVKYPLVVFLHGSGERGNNNENQLTWGADLFLDSANRKRFPAIVIFPQCPMNSSWDRHRQVPAANDSLGGFRFNADTVATAAMTGILSFIDTLEAHGTVDKNRVYIGGLSMGGFGTFDALQRRPDLFAAAFPICGGGDPNSVKRYRKKLPVWVFHGDADFTVPVANSRVMVAALQKSGARVKFTEYPGVGHDSWKNAFAEKELMPWLFAQAKNK